MRRQRHVLMQPMTAEMEPGPWKLTSSHRHPVAGCVHQTIGIKVMILHNIMAIG